MTKVQLVITEVDGEDEYKIINLIGINKDMLVHASPSGQMFFALTERVRVIGRVFDRSDPQEIYRLIERTDIMVMFIDKMIFWDPNWGQDMVERMIEEIDATT